MTLVLAIDLGEFKSTACVYHTPAVRLPDAATRQWRSLITYRPRLVGRRRAIKNCIRAILDRQGRSLLVICWAMRRVQTDWRAPTAAAA